MNIYYAMILIGFLLICYFHQQLLDHKDLRARLQRFYATMISKKIFAWFVITGFFCYDQYVVKEYQFSILEYMGFTATVFCIDVAQKFAGLKGKDQDQ